MKVEFVLPPAAKVTLLSITKYPAYVLSVVTRGYTQVYDGNIMENEITDMLDQIHRTRLQTPLEFVNMVWLLNDVSRAFTHQLVRYRMGTAYVQESMRFADKRKSPKVLITPEVYNKSAERELYETAVMEAFDSYDKMIEAGVPIQDARGVIPHHVLTNIFFSCNLKTLAHIYEQRTCCQAQHHEWPDVMRQMKMALPESVQRFIRAPWETGAKDCGFGATFDRPCKYPERWPK